MIPSTTSRECDAARSGSTVVNVGGDNERRQAGGVPLVLKCRYFGFQHLRRGSPDIVLGDIDAGNQPLFGQIGHFAK
jgi:hypothetical protein